MGVLRLQTILSFNTWICLKHLKTYQLFKKKIKCTSPLFLTLISLLRFFDRVLFEKISQFAANLSQAGVLIHFRHSCCRYKMKEKRKCWFPVQLLKYLGCTYMVWYAKEGFTIHSDHQVVHRNSMQQSNIVG